MRTVSSQSCFWDVLLFKRTFKKNWPTQLKPTWTHIHAHTRTHALTHTHMHARAHTHTHVCACAHTHIQALNAWSFEAFCSVLGVSHGHGEWSTEKVLSWLLNISKFVYNRAGITQWTRSCRGPFKSSSCHLGTLASFFKALNSSSHSLLFAHTMFISQTGNAKLIHSVISRIFGGAKINGTRKIVGFFYIWIYIYILVVGRYRR